MNAIFMPLCTQRGRTAPPVLLLFLYVFYRASTGLLLRGCASQRCRQRRRGLWRKRKRTSWYWRASSLIVHGGAWVQTRATGTNNGGHLPLFSDASTDCPAPCRLSEFKLALEDELLLDDPPLSRNTPREPDPVAASVHRIHSLMPRVERRSVEPGPRRGDGRVYYGWCSSLAIGCSTAHSQQYLEDATSSIVFTVDIEKLSVEFGTHPRLSADSAAAGRPCLVSDIELDVLILLTLL